MPSASDARPLHVKLVGFGLYRRQPDRLQTRQLADYFERIAGRIWDGHQLYRPASALAKLACMPNRNQRRRRAKYPTLAAPASSPPEASSTKLSQSTLLWGTFSIAVALTLPVIAVLKDIRWLLFVSWPFWTAVIWECAHFIQSPRKKTLTAGAGLFFAVSLFALYLGLPPPANSVAGASQPAVATNGPVTPLTSFDQPKPDQNLTEPARQGRYTIDNVTVGNMPGYAVGIEPGHTNAPAQALQGKFSHVKAIDAGSPQAPAFDIGHVEDSTFDSITAVGQYQGMRVLDAERSHFSNMDIRQVPPPSARSDKPPSAPPSTEQPRK